MMDDNERSWMLDAVAIAGVGVLWAETIAALIALPAMVPTSFAGSGPPQAYASKFSLLIMPVIGLVTFFMTSLFSQMPIRVTGMRIPPERVDEVNRVGRFFMRVLRVVLLFGFALLQFAIILSERAQFLVPSFGIIVAAFELAIFGTVALMIARIISIARS